MRCKCGDGFSEVEQLMIDVMVKGKREGRVHRGENKNDLNLISQVFN